MRDYEAIRRAADEGTHVNPQAEIAKREAMEAFTELVSVRPGDVVKAQLSPADAFGEYGRGRS